MFILAEENNSNFCDLLSALPERIRSVTSTIDTKELLELRLRCGGILSAVYKDNTYCVTKNGGLSKSPDSAIIVTDRDIKRAMELITKFSMYAYENEIKNGYITLPGGHRVGICGNAELSSYKISHLKSIQALNFRFSREIIGCSDKYMKTIYSDKNINNTVIVSPPMYGKTTLLRDIARNLSLLGKRVSIVDERYEIASVTNGISPFNLGLGCDILSGVSKSEGMLFMLRSMSPDVIITDEIGTSSDYEAIREIKKRGVSVITSLHGKDISLPEFDNVISIKGIGK